MSTGLVVLRDPSLVSSRLHLGWGWGRLGYVAWRMGQLEGRLPLCFGPSRLLHVMMRGHSLRRGTTWLGSLGSWRVRALSLYSATLVGVVRSLQGSPSVLADGFPGMNLTVHQPYAMPVCSSFSG